MWPQWNRVDTILRPHFSLRSTAWMKNGVLSPGSTTSMPPIFYHILPHVTRPASWLTILFSHLFSDYYLVLEVASLNCMWCPVSLPMKNIWLCEHLSWLWTHLKLEKVLAIEKWKTLSVESFVKLFWLSWYSLLFPWRINSNKRRGSQKN